MIRFRYPDAVQPPAPFVYVSVRRFEASEQLDSLPALVDSAADRTVITATVVQSLNLVADGKVLVQGFAGDIIELPTYLVEIRIHNLAPLQIRAILGQKEPYILLGRDVLNVYRICLDGPARAVTVEA